MERMFLREDFVLIVELKNLRMVADYESQMNDLYHFHFEYKHCLPIYQVILGVELIRIQIKSEVHKILKSVFILISILNFMLNQRYRNTFSKCPVGDNLFCQDSNCLVFLRPLCHFWSFCFRKVWNQKRNIFKANLPW